MRRGIPPARAPHLHDPHKGQLERVVGGRGEPRFALVNEERVEARVRLGRDDARKEEAAETHAVERDESEQQPLPQRRSSVWGGCSRNQKTEIEYSKLL